MDTKTDNVNKDGANSTLATSAEPTTSAGNGRRRFTRNMLVGGAVVATLGNRAAWGQTQVTGECISAGVFDSFTNGFASAAHPMHEEWQAQLTRMEQDVNSADEYVSGGPLEGYGPEEIRCRTANGAFTDRCDPPAAGDKYCVVANPPSGNPFGGNGN